VANTLPAVSSKPPGKKCREMEIALNLDFPAANGFPSVSVDPSESFHFSKELCVRVNACKNGEKRELCNLISLDRRLFFFLIVAPLRRFG
jgi:hypothetical protein